MQLKTKKLKVESGKLLGLVLLFIINYSLFTAFTGCAGFPIIGSKTTGKITTINENLNPNRLTDLAVVKKLAGYKKLLFTSNIKYTDWFEGFLKGEIVNEDGLPVENIQVMVDGIGFENAVTDINGVYKVRFSIPIVKGIADANGKLIIHPKWESELEIKGYSYQPAVKDALFRIYYNGNAGGVVALNEGKLPPKVTVKKITFGQYRVEVKKKEASEKSVETPAKSHPDVMEKPIKKEKKEKKDIDFGNDLFKQLENFNK